MGNKAHGAVKGALVATAAIVAAATATLYGALHGAGHVHAAAALPTQASSAGPSAGHAHPDAALLVAAAGLALVAVTWLVLPDSRRRTLPGHLALCSAAAATIHFAVVWPHVSESLLLGALFAFAGAFQLAWAPLVLVHPSRRVLAAGAVVNAGIALAWAVSRTVGLPFGPEAWSPESVGLADAAATIFELAIATGATVLRRELVRPLQGAAGRLAAQGPAVAIGVVLLLALTLLSGSTARGAKPRSSPASRKPRLRHNGAIVAA
jgi:hypothetical protein